MWLSMSPTENLQKLVVFLYTSGDLHGGQQKVKPNQAENSWCGAMAQVDKEPMQKVWQGQ